MNYDTQLLIDDFKHHFKYQPDGTLIRQNNRRNDLNGQVAGTLTKKGYVQISFKGKFYYAHQIIWAIHHNEFVKQIDHIDRVKHHNWIENLRKATAQTNAYNKQGSARGGSKFKGVYWAPHAKKFVARITVNKQVKHLGYFDDEYKAAEAYNKAAAIHHKQFACTEPSNEQ